MADSKISALPAITTLPGTAEFAVANSGVSNKITAANVSLAFQTLLADTTLGVDSANIDFAGISGSYKHLKIVCSLRTVAGATIDDVSIRFNADSGANYDYMAFDLGQGTIDLTGQTSGLLYSAMGDSATANYYSMCSIEIADYAGAHMKNYIAEGSNVGAATRRFKISTGIWKSTSAITEITIASTSANNLKAGSRASLYAF